MIVKLSKEEALATTFKALADPTRLRIFEFLRCCDREIVIGDDGSCRPVGSRSVGDICCCFRQSMSTVSHHLKELRQAGLIRTEKRGRWIYCRINPTGLESLRAFIESSPEPESNDSGR